MIGFTGSLPLQRGDIALAGDGDAVMTQLEGGRQQGLAVAGAAGPCTTVVQFHAEGFTVAMRGL